MKSTADKTETVRARAEIAAPATVVRGAVKIVWDDVVIDVARAPCVALPGPWRYVALRSCSVVRGQIAPADLERAREATAEAFAERIRARAAKAVEARLERLLVDLARRYGSRVSGGTFVALPLRGRDVASLVGTTTESVSRVFAAWKRAGRIRATRDGVWIAATLC